MAKINKNYKRGYHDGFEDGINEQKEIVDVLNEKLDKELEINRNIRIKADNARKEAESARKEAVSARKEADEQKERINGLKDEVQVIKQNIEELESKYRINQTAIEKYEAKVKGLDEKNKSITKHINAISDIEDNYVKNVVAEEYDKKIKISERISSLNTRIHALNDQNLGLEFRIKDLKSNMTDAIITKVMTV